MIFIDSWAWLEVTLPGEHASDARSVLEEGEREGAIVASTVLTEVYDVLDREKGSETAENAMAMIDGFENLEVLPVTPAIAIRGAQLRRKYYSPASDCTPSYGDMIHLATAAEIADCDRLYTRDTDFESVSEVDCHVIGR